MITFIGPSEKNEAKKKIKRSLQNVQYLFLFAVILPIIVVLLFQFNVLISKPAISKDIQKPVAMVSTDAGFGTAFLVNSTMLITAGHLVRDLQLGDLVSLSFENAKPTIETQAKIIWKETRILAIPEFFLTDIAVLELTNPDDIPTDFPRSMLGFSSDVVSTDEVVAIGYPAGLATITTGTISNTSVKDLDLFQLDCNVYPGNSGGPLILKSSNEVIGVVVAALIDEFQGINFAIKIDNVLDLLGAFNIEIFEE